ncbi:MAG: hypothetical protein R3F65_17635 [bacterium]
MSSRCGERARVLALALAAFGCRREPPVDLSAVVVERAPAPGWGEAYDVALAIHLRALGTEGVDRVRLSPVVIDGSTAPYLVRIERFEAGGGGDGAMLVHQGDGLAGRGGAAEASAYFGAIGFPARRTLSAGMVLRLLTYFSAAPDVPPLHSAMGPTTLTLVEAGGGVTLIVRGWVQPSSGRWPPGEPGAAAPVERRLEVHIDRTGRVGRWR